jgi:hypothetical protein
VKQPTRRSDEADAAKDERNSAIQDHRAGICMIAVTARHPDDPDLRIRSIIHFIKMNASLEAANHCAMQRAVSRFAHFQLAVLYQGGLQPGPRYLKKYLAFLLGSGRPGPIHGLLGELAKSTGPRRNWSVNGHDLPPGLRGNGRHDLGAGRELLSRGR